MQDGGHLDDVETFRLEEPVSFAWPAGGSNVVRHESRASDPVERQRIADGDHWIDRVVHGQDEVPTIGEHPMNLGQALGNLTRMVEVIERRIGDDEIERTARIWQLPDICDDEACARRSQPYLTRSR